MGEQQQKQPSLTKSAPGVKIENLYSWRGKKKNENLRIYKLTEVREVRVVPMESHLKPTAKTSPIQPKVMRMNQRLERPSLQTTLHRTQNLADTHTMTGNYIIVCYQKGIFARYKLTIGN